VKEPALYLLFISFGVYRTVLKNLLMYLFNRDANDKSEHLSLVISESILFLYLLNINPFWPAFTEDLALHEIIVNLLTLLLWPSLNLPMILSFSLVLSYPHLV